LWVFDKEWVPLFSASIFSISEELAEKVEEEEEEEEEGDSLMGLSCASSSTAGPLLVLLLPITNEEDLIFSDEPASLRNAKYSGCWRSRLVASCAIFPASARYATHSEYRPSRSG
jgi:hypothetical protein